MEIYKITFDNYQGENFIELYHKKQNAISRFKELKQDAQTKAEFDDEINMISFFDHDYNEYSTYITFEECTLDSLFYD